MALYSSKGKIILASASPRRRELLAATGLEFEIEAPQCNELQNIGEKPKEYAIRIALMKAESVAAKHRDAWVIGADTSVVQNGEILGKPTNKENAARMLQILQGCMHQVVGAFAVLQHDKNISHVEVHSTDVEMRKMSLEEIYAYIASNEPMDKAGAYAIQGIGGAFVQRIDGSVTNVVGLNLSALLTVLVNLGAIVANPAKREIMSSL